MALAGAELAEAAASAVRAGVAILSSPEGAQDSRASLPALEGIA